MIYILALIYIYINITDKTLILQEYVFEKNEGDTVSKRYNVDNNAAKHFYIGCSIF